MTPLPSPIRRSADRLADVNRFVTDCLSLSVDASPETAVARSSSVVTASFGADIELHHDEGREAAALVGAQEK